MRTTQLEVECNHDRIRLADNWRTEIGGSKIIMSSDLCSEVWGQGLMPEALQVIVRYGFAEMNLNRIEALTHIENQRSQRF